MLTQKRAGGNGTAPEPANTVPIGANQTVGAGPPRVLGARAVPPNQEKIAHNPAVNERVERLEALLTLEAEIRSTQTLRELIFCIANNTRNCISVRQTYVLRRARHANTSLKIDTVSNISAVDRNAPAIRWLEAVFSRSLAAALTRDQAEHLAPFSFDIPKPEGDGAAVFPFRYGLIVPQSDRKGNVFSSVALVSESPFKAGDVLVLKRLSSAYQHAWLAIAPRPGNRLTWFFNRWVFFVVCALAMAALFLPVPLTTLAPTEVVAQQPQVVAAPIDGVVANMLVEPNIFVQKGETLFVYVDTDFAARQAIAKQKSNVARARLQTARQNSFASSDGRRDLAIAKAELDLANAELAHATSQLNKTNVVAPVSGLAVFERQSDWQGKPVTTGERIIEIADPANVDFRIDLAVSDAIVMRQGARAKVFLDADPLSPIEAVIDSTSYRASMSTADQLVYKAYASASDSSDKVPRIGARGTVQIYGDQVSLGFYLFRRPLSAIRQWFGV